MFHFSIIVEKERARERERGRIEFVWQMDIYVTYIHERDVNGFTPGERQGGKKR